MLWRRIADQPLVRVVRAGAELHSEPGKDHCLIRTEDLLVVERSVDPKGDAPGYRAQYPSEVT